MTIICESKKFVFIKGRKVASTSVEVGLSSFCQSNDILTPMTPIDEVLRFQRTGLTAQNYGADNNKVNRYRDRIISFVNNPPEDWSSVRKPRGDYEGHSAFQDIENVYGGFPSNWTVIAISRNPYDQALSRIKHIANKKSIQHRTMEVLDVNGPEMEAARSKFFCKVKNGTLPLNIDLYKDKAGKLSPTFVIRYEQLSEDFQKLAKHLGCFSTDPLPHLKKNEISEALPPKELFSEEEIEIINDFYDEEFAAFGYEKLS